MCANSTMVKICGLKNIQDARILNRTKADYAGLVMFYEKSKRNNTIESAWQVLRYLERKYIRAAVTVSPTWEQVQMLEQMDFQILQVHGILSEEVLEKTKLDIWRAVNITKDSRLSEIESHSAIKGYVLDGASPGSGKTFDWNSMKGFNRKDRKLILAGGLTVENVQEAIRMVKPDVLDVSSYVENETGKDEDKIKEFIRKVKEYE